MTEQEQITPRLAAPVTRETINTSSEPNQGAELSIISEIGQFTEPYIPFAGDDAE
ncbi:anacyclamide/piricyclamide family prenylated cyclic peptide [Streptomyces sp. 1222.5]|uniref:anacyclamide/piricyclamide family prenylated cyclic peptide n=1 Tax=Streptomyces sp. 1222.5 TaxID=1881026 RepID=UPI003D72B9DC